jgi:cytochrome c oxidase cbb3-type subunit 3
MEISYIEIWLISLLIMTSLVILTVALLLYSALKKMTKTHEVTDKKTSSWWQTFTGLRPIEEEKNMVIKDSHDGIIELDNPTPPWFMYLFYGSILFGVIYMINYHVLQDGNIQETEYKSDMAIAEKERAAYLKKFDASINENNVLLTKSSKDLQEGKEIYKTNCVACHGSLGQGGIGPNFTDQFWIHGGGIKDLYKTIFNGVPQKGMISWNKTLNPLKIQQVASYILSLQGTNPAGAKVPQGVETK